MRRTRTFAISALLLYAIAIPAHATTITVTNTNDSGPGSLRQAILNASSGDTINFAPTLTTVTLTSGELVIDKNLIITGPGANRLTVQVNPNVISARVFNISSSTVTVSISGITISNGFAEDGPGGGGILSAGVLTLTNSTISDSFSGFQFGGVLGGGGVMNDHGTMTITSCTISNNSTGNGFKAGGGGGGVLNDHGTMTITGCTISNNQGREGASGGGGVLNENGTMTITGCTISNNFAGVAGFASFSSEGGGISNPSGSLIITNSTISGNTSSAFQGDFFPVTAFGGGVDNSGSMTITNCTISGNLAVGGTSNDTGNGGGISNGGNLQITSSTIVHNSATGGNGAFGGGINGFEPTRADSSIIALNSASTGGPDYFTNGGELQSTGYNIIGNNAGAVINSQPTDQIGTPAAPIDPLLGPLANNGGPTLTHALQSGSLAIDRGDPAAPPHDQRGYSRLGVPDVGAFEFNGGSPRYDFNGDGYPDYVLNNASTRRTAIWYLNNNVFIGSAYGPTLPPGWTLIDVADFNGDSHPDYALYDAITRRTAIWYLNNNVFLRSAYGPTLTAGWSLLTP
jgi:hypothetical protein